MKRRLLALGLLLLLALAGCGAQGGEAQGETGPGDDTALSFTDSLGHEITLDGPPQRVAALMGSYAETWLLAGGELAGATNDAITERGLELGEETVNLGRIQQPDVEQLIALEPDLVLLSAETEGQLALEETLAQAGIPAAYFQVDDFDDYLVMLRICCDLTGREDLYEENGARLQERIDEIISSVPDGAAPRVLYLRAYSTGVKAKGADTLAGAMLEDLGADNLAEGEGASLLEELQLETIVQLDPDFIFVTTMGSDDDKAMEQMEQLLTSNPAWASLTAVQEGRYHVLPKDLFHYKPNARWDESYEMLYDILYGGENG